MTNSPNLSAETTPKLVTLWCQSATVAIAAPARPITPSGPIGIFSPGSRNASAIIAASAAAATHAIGTIAFRDDGIISDHPGAGGWGWWLG